MSVKTDRATRLCNSYNRMIAISATDLNAVVDACINDNDGVPYTLSDFDMLFMEFQLYRQSSYREIYSFSDLQYISKELKRKLSPVHETVFNLSSTKREEIKKLLADDLYAN